MMTSFSTALSALSATSAAVNVVGNDLANLNTTGFKAEDVQFSDLVSQALGGGSEVGLGVGLPVSKRNWVQGSIQQTSGPLDAAIQGGGFFILRDSNNQTLYTRAGNFTVDSSGHVISASGNYVQGWSAVNGVLNTNSPIGNVVIPANGVVPASPTKNVSVTVNLDSAGAVGKLSGTYSTPIEVYDSQGGKHTLTMTFTKTATNKWNYEVTVPSDDVTGSNSLAKGSLEFDGTGLLKTPSSTAGPVSIDLSGLTDGAADMTVNWNLFNGDAGMLTQYAQDSAVSASTQDGMASGQISKIGMSDGGMIVATYTNGQQASIAQIAVASIANPDSLVAVGGNAFQATAATSEPAVGTAGTGGRGAIKGGALESSTVDIATEFTKLITYQRTYQANSRVITTADQMTQDLLTVVR